MTKARRQLINAVLKEAQATHPDDYIYPKRKEFQEELADEIKAAVPADKLAEFMTVLTSMVTMG